MAITESGLYVQNFVDMMDATQLAFNYISDAMNCALVDNTATPNFTTNTAWADISAAEITGTGYTAKGAVLGTKTLTATGGAINFDAADASWTTATITARAAVILDDTLASPLDALICLLNFGSDITSTAGTFTVQFAAGGFIQIPHV